MTKVLYSDEWVTVTADLARRRGVVKVHAQQGALQRHGRGRARCFGGVRAVLPHLYRLRQSSSSTSASPPPRNDAAFGSRTGAGLQEFAQAVHQDGDPRGDPRREAAYEEHRD